MSRSSNKQQQQSKDKDQIRRNSKTDINFLLNHTVPSPDYLLPNASSQRAVDERSSSAGGSADITLHRTVSSSSTLPLLTESTEQSSVQESDELPNNRHKSKEIKLSDLLCFDQPAVEPDDIDRFSPDCSIASRSENISSTAATPFYEYSVSQSSVASLPRDILDTPILQHAQSMGCAQSLPKIRAEMVIIQQPVQSKACGWTDTHRKYIDPPPIVALQSSDPSHPIDYSASPFLLVVVSLWSDEHRRPLNRVTKVSDGVEFNQKQALCGTTAAGFDTLQGIDGQRGQFCFFPDLSVRVEGTFRLRFKLISAIEQHDEQQVLSELLSNPFGVYGNRNFCGTLVSSTITKHFAQQGVRLPLRKTSDPDKAH